MYFIEKIKRLFKQDKKEEKSSKDSCSNALKEKYKDLLKKCIRINIENRIKDKKLSYFGGNPTVPKDFKWPYFETALIDDSQKKLRPLSFLAQFDFSELKNFDVEGLFPQTGILSFFYCVDSEAGDLI